MNTCVCLGLSIVVAAACASAALHTPAAGRSLKSAEAVLSPVHSLHATSSAFEGPRPAKEGVGSRPIADLPGGVMEGQLVHVGRGCIGDVYLNNPAGKIALIERGHCLFQEKFERALGAGAIGVVVYDQAGEILPTMLVSHGVPVDLPGAFVWRSTGLDLRDGAPPVTVRIAKPGNEYFFDYLEAGLQSLRDASVISNGQMTSLLNRVALAQRQLERGNPAGAISALTLFMSQVQGLVDAGTLDPGDGAFLIEAAQAIIDSLA